MLKLNVTHYPSLLPVFITEIDISATLGELKTHVSALIATNKLIVIRVTRWLIEFRERKIEVTLAPNDTELRHLGITDASPTHNIYVGGPLKDSDGETKQPPQPPEFEGTASLGESTLVAEELLAGNTQMPMVALWVALLSHRPDVSLGIAMDIRCGLERNASLEELSQMPQLPLRAAKLVGATPLMLATMALRQDVVVLFLAARADPNVRLPEGEVTPLHFAARDTLVVAVRALVNDGANMNAADREGRTPLHYAANDNVNVVVVETLLELGADIHSVTIAGGTIAGQTPLHAATHVGTLEIARALLRGGAVHTLADANNRTPLHLAALGGHHQIVELLLQTAVQAEQRGVEVSNNNNDNDSRVAVSDSQARVATPVKSPEKNNSSSYPLQTAAASGDLATFKDLLSKGSAPDSKDGGDKTAMHWAAENGHANIAEALVASGVPMGARDKMDKVPLHHACNGGHLDVVRLLLKNGERADSVDSKGRTPLHYAAMAGKVMVIAELGQSSPETVTAADSNGCTPLHYAASFGNTDCVKTLLASDASAQYLDCLSNAGHSALSLAAEAGCANVITLLLSKGAQPDIVLPGANRIALHLAAVAGNLAAVRALLEGSPKGSSMYTISRLAPIGLDAKDIQLRTPLHLAARLGHVEVAKLLVQYGAVPTLHRDISNKSPHDLATPNVRRMFDSVVEDEADENQVKEEIQRETEPIFADLADSEGLTALHLAAYEGYTNAAATLIRYNASVNATDLDGQTPLHKATSISCSSTIYLLVAEGASAVLADTDRKTAMHCISESRYTSDKANLMKVIIEAGADSTEPDRFLNTPLHLAARSCPNEDLRPIKLLLEDGAAVGPEDIEGLTAAAVAEREHHEDIAALLLGRQTATGSPS